MGLFGITAIAEQSLETQQAGLQVTANNIANVNTPGYTRRVAELAEQAPFSMNVGSGGGGGVTLQQVQAIRDSVLEIRLNQETSNQSKLTSLQQQLGPVQSLFNAQSGAGLNTAIDNFFAAVQQLSTNPSNGAQRQSVITAGQTMAQTFNQVSTAVSQQISGADQYVVQDVGQVNDLTSQIAQLNGQIASLQNVSPNTAALVDQRTNLVRNLSQLMDFTVSDGGNGQVTLTTSGGQELVSGNQSVALTLAPNSSGNHDIYDQGTDITSSIAGGSLAGLIEARDTDLPNLSTQLNALATTLAQGVNTQNALGYDLNGNPGGNLFTPPGANAAATMSMATTDPSAIAASASSTDPGDNSNLLTIAALQQQTNSSGLTPDGAYAGIVSSIGSLVQGVNTQQQASQAVLTQLQNQRASVSGVSMDEETINLTQFQQGYQAAARVVGIINQLTSLAINLGQD